MKIFIFCITLFAISLRCMCNKYIHLFSSCLLLQFHRELLISNSLNSNHSGFLSIPLIKPILFEDAILIALQILASLCTPQHSGPHTCAHTHTRVWDWTTYFSFKYQLICFSRKDFLCPLPLYHISLKPSIMHSYNTQQQFL